VIVHGSYGGNLVSVLTIAGFLVRAVMPMSGKVEMPSAPSCRPLDAPHLDSHRALLIKPTKHVREQDDGVREDAGLCACRRS